MHCKSDKFKKFAARNIVLTVAKNARVGNHFQWLVHGGAKARAGSRRVKLILEPGIVNRSGN